MMVDPVNLTGLDAEMIKKTGVRPDHELTGSHFTLKDAGFPSLVRLELPRIAMKYRTDIAALLAKNAVPAGDCIEWSGYRNQHGYGRATVTLADGSAKLVAVHRLAFETAHGDPSGTVIMHTCDNRACINPSHLRLGTQADNLADMRRKGRAVSRGWRAAAIRGEIKIDP